MPRNLGWHYSECESRGGRLPEEPLGATLRRTDEVVDSNSLKALGERHLNILKSGDDDVPPDRGSHLPNVLRPAYRPQDISRSNQARRPGEPITSSSAPRCGEDAAPGQSLQDRLKIAFGQTVTGSNFVSRNLGHGAPFSSALVGGLLPELWGGSVFSYTSVLLSGAGAFLALWIGAR
jgi:hypothetical protein